MGLHRVAHDWSDLAAAAAGKNTQEHTLESLEEKIFLMESLFSRTSLLLLFIHGAAYLDQDYLITVIFE